MRVIYDTQLNFVTASAEGFALMCFIHECSSISWLYEAKDWLIDKMKDELATLNVEALEKSSTYVCV